MIYKIAAVTEDGQQISSHFGMAPQYHVFTIENGRVVSKETLAKPHHSQHPDGSRRSPDHTLDDQKFEPTNDSHTHGHEDMFAPIATCRVLICGGMGTPAYEKAKAVGLEVLLTGGEIQAAVESYLTGELTSDWRRVHRH